MLLLMMELKGRFNSKMIKKAKFGDMYFDEMGGFESVETDRITGAVRTRPYFYPEPSHLTVVCVNRLSSGKSTYQNRHGT